MESKDRVLGALGETRMPLVPRQLSFWAPPLWDPRLLVSASAPSYFSFLLCGSAPPVSLCPTASQLTMFSVLGLNNQEALTPYFKSQFRVRESAQVRSATPVVSSGLGGGTIGLTCGLRGALPVGEGPISKYIPFFLF